ncbi:hypothetical protein OC861_006850 [Tilletia horrida]|nr:hypothetical protein OC861_006850 [Tilletia horrida]
MNFTRNDLGGSLSKIPTLLGAKNYFKWRRAFSPVLLGFRALSIVEGKGLCPTIGKKATTIDLKQYETWQDRDAKAMSIIEQTVCGSLKAMIEDLTSSAEKWAHLAKLNNLKTSEVSKYQRTLRFFLPTMVDLRATRPASGIPVRSWPRLTAWHVQIDGHQDLVQPSFSERFPDFSGPHGPA